MEPTTTMQHRGTMPGRTRIDASGLPVHATGLPTMRSWRSDTPAFLGCTTSTGVAAVPTNAYVNQFTSIKRTARHLGTGST